MRPSSKAPKEPVAPEGQHLTLDQAIEFAHTDNPIR
jgi:hypothetical protein